MWNSFQRNFTRNWVNNPAMQLATTSVLVGVFFVVNISFLIHHNFDSLLTRWGREVKMSLYLKKQTTEKEIQEIRVLAKKYPAIELAKYVSETSAFERFKDEMGSLIPDLMEGKGFENPLPASVELSFRAGDIGGAKTSLLKKIASDFLKVSAVEDVSYGQNWVSNYSSFVAAFNVGSLVLIMVLMAGGLLVIGNSIRGALYQRSEEIEILELIGATKSTIMAPYILEGVIMGFVCSGISLVLSYVVYRSQLHIFSEQMGFWGLGLELSFLPLTKIFLVMSLGGIFGGLGSYFCINKLSTGWAAARG